MLITRNVALWKLTFLIDIPDDNTRLQSGKVKRYQTTNATTSARYEHHLTGDVLRSKSETQLTACKYCIQMNIN